MNLQNDTKYARRKKELEQLYVQSPQAVVLRPDTLKRGVTHPLATTIGYTRIVVLGVFKSILLLVCIVVFQLILRVLMRSFY